MSSSFSTATSSSPTSGSSSPDGPENEYEEIYSVPKSKPRSVYDCPEIPQADPYSFDDDQDDDVSDVISIPPPPRTS